MDSSIIGYIFIGLALFALFPVVLVFAFELAFMLQAAIRKENNPKVQ